jgi:hypothetical protein
MCHCLVTFAGLFMKDFQLDIEKAFRNVCKPDHKNESMCKSSHVVPRGGRSVKHSDAVESPARAIRRIQVSVVWGAEYLHCCSSSSPHFQSWVKEFDKVCSFKVVNCNFLVHRLAI